MSGVPESQAKDGTRPQKPKAPGKKEVKILMLHGEFKPYFSGFIIFCSCVPCLMRFVK